MLVVVVVWWYHVSRGCGKMHREERGRGAVGLTKGIDVIGDGELVDKDIQGHSWDRVTVEQRRGR